MSHERSTSFGNILRELRLAAGLSQEALAERARMSAGGISALERGIRRTPYRDTVSLLAEALSLSPEDRTQLEAAAARRPEPRRRGASVGQEPRRHNLPAELTSFIGREANIAEIASLLREHRLVTLTGPGGVGKTRASLQVAANLIDAFSDGVWFVGLAPLTNGEYIPSTVAQALEITLASKGDPAENLVPVLKEKCTLLVFDNCEHLVDPAARVISALLRGCPTVKVLASSRQALGITGEVTYRMPSLPIPAAIELFLTRARDVYRQFALTEENATIVGEICRLVDGIPLGIELAAARMKMLTPKQLHERLGKRFRLLTGGDRGAPPRHQTMRALIDWSYNLLDDPERALFRRLGIFVNGFTLEGAIAVGSEEDLDELDVFDVLASLIDKSLVVAEPEGDEVRYRLLESTRAYALEKLEDAGERDLVASRHLCYLRDRFAELWERRERTGRGSSDLAWALQTELEDVRSALDGALARSEILDGGELLANIYASFPAIGLDAEGLARCWRYLAALPVGQPRLRARLSAASSTLLGDSGQWARAFELATEAVDQARASDDASLLARALRLYADAATCLRRFDDAERALAQAETIPETAASFTLRVSLLEARALLSRFRGDLEAAADVYEQLRKQNRSLGNTYGEQLAALNLADLEHARGHTQRAIAIVRETLPEARSRGNKGTHTLLLCNLAAYLAAVDDLSDAAKAARDAIGSRASSERDHVYVAIAIKHLALVFALRGDCGRAATLEGYADDAFQRHNFEGEFTETTTHDRLTALLHERLVPADLAGLMAEGATLTPEAAVALALEEHDAK
jgi:predicted ATPase/DNA-binding XRE family transcriptional regulator